MSERLLGFVSGGSKIGSYCANNSLASLAEKQTRMLERYHYRSYQRSHFFRIKACMGPIITVIASFKFRQWATGIDGWIIGSIIGIDHQTTIEYQRTLIGSGESIVIDSFVETAEESLYR